jgi:hypothetical protein
VQCFSSIQHLPEVTSTPEVVSPSIGGKQERGANDIETAGTGPEGLTFTLTDGANIFPVMPRAMVISFCASSWSRSLVYSRPYVGSPFLKVGAAAIDLAVDAIEKTRFRQGCTQPPKPRMRAT